MKVVVRPLADGDLPDKMARLRTLVRPHDPESRDTDWHSSIWRWLETHPLADEMHRWVLVAGDGEVVGHLAALPQFYRVNGRRVVAHTPADYQVLPQYGFHAIPLMRKFFRTCENCVSCDTMPAPITLEKRLGAEEAGKLQFAAKLWDVSGLPYFPSAIPEPVTRPLNWGLRVADRVLVTLFGDVPRAELLKGFDESFDELFEQIAAAVPCLPEKGAAFLRWRYGPGSPQSPVTILGVRDERRMLLGYAVLWVSEARDGYPLDLTTLPGRHDVARVLLVDSVRHFRRAGVRSIRYRFLESLTSPRLGDLRRLGFFPYDKGRYTLLVKFKDSDLHETANKPAHWSYNVGDGEASFWAR